MKAHKDIIYNMVEKLTTKPDTTGWQRRHLNAWFKTDSANAIPNMLHALAGYADKHAQRFESRLGDDYFLSPPWASMLLNVRTLLNGELDGLDGGTLDGLILDMLALEGFDENGEKNG